MSTLRAGLIGMGSMGRNHARVLDEMPDVHFVGAVDPAVRGALNTIAALLTLKPDMAVIAAPTSKHLPAAFELANAGVHLLIEKPLAGSEHNARQIIDAVQRAGVHAAVGHIERFNPAIRELHQRLPALGRLHMIQTVRSGPWHGRIMDTGVIRDLATHDLDLVEWLGGPIDMIYADTVRAFSGPHEDLAVIAGRTTRDVVFQITTDWLSPAKGRCTRVLGEHGTLTADTLKQRLTLHKHGKQPVDYLLPTVEPLRAELDALAHLVRTGEHGQLATLTEGLQAVIHADRALHTTPLRTPCLEVAA